jgi:predicted membrane channel-forming protein YqfA (hemolysin III family)
MLVFEAPDRRIGRAMTAPSRKLAGIALICGLIALWAAFVASLAPLVGKWPALLQAPYYLFMGVAWVIPLKPLVRWAQTGSFRPRP